MMRKGLFLRRCKFFCILGVALLCCFAGVIMATFRDRARGNAEGEHSYSDHGTAITGAVTLGDGNYYLDGDITGNIIVNGTVNLCLNGHTLSASSGSVVTVESGTLNLYDCSGTNAGTITGGDGENGGGILVSGNVLNMYGGTITGNAVSGDGGGINVSADGRFTMYGGVISDNVARGNGGGVYICHYNGSRATFDMRGGKITGNRSEIGGGGVHMNDAADSISVSGGEITGNRGVYGGVYVTGGITSVGLSGAVKITNNSAIAGSASNLYLTNGAATVSGPLSDGAFVGISLGASHTGVFVTGYATHNGGKDPSLFFGSDANPDLVCGDNGSGGLTFGTLEEIRLAVADIIWQSGATDLINGPVYEYTGGGDPIYSAAQINPVPSGYTETRMPAANSLVYHTGSTITLGLYIAGSPHYVVNYDVEGYDDNVQTDCGKYTSAVELTANKGYVFALGGNAENANYGVTVTISEDKKSATIVKTWYIIDEGTATGVNAFLTERGGTYAIADFAFGVSEANFPVAMPRLRYGDDNADWAENDLLSFTLSSTDASGVAVLGSTTFRRAEFYEYLNCSMPAGVYRLRIAVGEVSVAAGVTPWWSSEQVANAMTCPQLVMTYSFTVSAASIRLNIDKIDADAGYLDYAWEIYDDRDKNSFFDMFENKLKAAAPDFAEVERKGYWRGANWNAHYYDGTYYVKYNFARMYDNKYYAPNDIQSYIRGGTSGTYKVFFQISAPNHEDLAVGANRYEYFFTVTVFEKISAPSITAPVYTGAKALPEIASDSRYSVEWEADDDYISGGTHYVLLTLGDSVHYRWADEASTTGENKRTLRVPFVTAAADNEWLQAPYAVGWEFGAYDAEVNRINSVVKYGNDKPKYYTVATDAACAQPVAGLERFAASDETAVDIFKTLTAGTYYIKGVCESTADYKALESTPVPFRVTKTVNYWEDAPAIVGWADGKYDAAINTITARPRCGAESVVISVADVDGKEYYNSATGLDELGKAPVGDYFLTATVAETSSYSGLEKTVVFRIFENEGGGLPWWAILLIVLGVLLIVFVVFVILYKKGAVQIVTEKMVVAIRTRADTDATIAAVRAGKIAAESERAKMSDEVAAAARAAAIAEEDAASDIEEALPEEDDDGEDTAAYEPEADDKEVSSSTGFAKAFAVSSSASYTYGKTVLSKLITAPDNVKARYSELKNYLLSFKKARANMSRARESYYIGRKCYARVAMRGKTLCMYIAADPAKYDGTKYNVENVSEVKMYADTPCLLRIRSDRALRYAKELIDELATDLAAVRIERKTEDYAELFKNIEKLEKKNLLSYRGRKQRVKSADDADTNKGER